MPLEIKELQISITVNQQPKAGEAPPSEQAGKDDKKALAQQCIDDVLNIINQKKER